MAPGSRRRPAPDPDQNHPFASRLVHRAEAGDVAEIFGDPHKKGNFIIGYTREQNHPVCMDMEKFVQRSALGYFWRDRHRKILSDAHDPRRVDPARPLLDLDL